MAGSSIHISLNAEPVAYIGQFAITNSIAVSIFVSLVLISLSLYAHNNIKQSRRPQGFQNVLEALVEAFYNMVHATTHQKKKSLAVLPVVMGSFFFILLNNWLGLLPGVGTIGITKEPHPTEVVAEAHAATEATETLEGISRDESPFIENIEHKNEGEYEAGEAEHKVFIPVIRPGTADLNTTVALALVSVIMTQVVGVQFLGVSYFSKFFNVHGIHSFVGILELISEISKIISFAFRLFGNIFAGEVLLTVIAFLVPVIVPVPFIGLEIFVGFVQALVFAMLTMVFMAMAMAGHGDDH